MNVAFLFHFVIIFQFSIAICKWIVKKYPIFWEGVVKRTFAEFNKESLGEIPINPEVGKLADLGTQLIEGLRDHEFSIIYISLAEKLKSTYL